jgi:hypothetical protein
VANQTVAAEIRNSSPIFVVGRDRAAAGQLARLLGTHERLGVVPVSGLLGDLAAAAVRNQAGLAPYGYPDQYWFSSLAAAVDSLQHGHVARAGKERWIDCPPWAHPTVEVIDRLFPRAQIVQVTGAAGFRARTDRNVARATAALGAGRYLEIPVAELGRDGAACMGRLFEFLGESAPGGTASPAAMSAAQSSLAA